ncbi:smalltalk protein [Prevotella histicola]|uniref:Smalltalk protein n=1 Tax=Prevotella histicola TaxID=470565 RepID=A0A930HZH1_9BACT|nr:smalltalk protein [Prevotella histicola]MBF1392107.1 smalltalk protein [Prevotella histicola]MBF1395016.1 smalltalk protein [Prevotella histicola]MBF1398989.1 smalltalk protein [Prevotella histicola]MBF1401165.1 smalltalk protein [Prevotella histicola]MBF1408386.1 smalltalk protein [Prevotella histicola]
MKQSTWKLILQIAVTVITAIATSLGVTSCR